LEGWRVASKGLGTPPRRRGSALALGCGRGGRAVLPLVRAAAVSTGLRVRVAHEDVRARAERQRDVSRAAHRDHEAVPGWGWG